MAAGDASGRTRAAAAELAARAARAEPAFAYIQAPRAEYRSVVRKHFRDRVYLLFRECTRSDYNGDVRGAVSGDEFALVACRFCHRKQPQFCPDSYEAYGGGACFHCDACTRFNAPDRTYWVQGKIFEYSGWMCLNDAYDKTQFVRAKKASRRVYKELAAELKDLCTKASP